MRMIRLYNTNDNFSLLLMNNIIYYIMKRLLYFLTLTLVPLTMYATGQEGDIIYIDGVQWELLGKPVYADSVLSSELKNALPKERGIISSNWAGYTAYWSIRQEKLYLDSIRYEVYESANKSKTECLSSKVLRRIFKKHVNRKRIVATWFNNEIRVAKGKQLYYEHDGYMRNYEHERIISIEQGKVCGTKDYQNYVVEGFSFDKYRPKSNAELREKFPLHIEQYPELADVKRIVFNVKRARVDAQGNLVECEVKVFRPNDNPRLAAEMAEAMKAYRPWRVMFINGEYRAYGIEGYTIPYNLEE